MRLKSLLVVVVLASPICVTAIGCKSFETNLQDTDVDYQTTARQNFEAGDTAFADEDYNDAIKFFDYVKNKFPYSKYAVLAELRVADAHFAREEWVQAADAYRLFARFHPSHESVPYASFRAALSYYEEIAKDPLDDVWLVGTAMTYLSPFPSPEERDQTATKDAIRAFDEYLVRYPDDENADEARRLRLEAREKLAAHDLYAAEFYVQREKFQGAIWRHEHIAHTYADTSLAPASLVRAADIAENKLDDDAMTLALVERVLKEYPESEEAKTMETRAAALRVKVEAKKKSDAIEQEARALRRAESDKKKEAAAAKKKAAEDEKNQNWVEIDDAERDAAANDDAADNSSNDDDKTGDDAKVSPAPR